MSRILILDKKQGLVVPLRGFSYKSEFGNVVRGTKFNMSFARRQNVVFSVGVLKICASTHHEHVVRNNVFYVGMVSCALEVHNSFCFTMHLHEYVNAFENIVLCKLECPCVCVCVCVFISVFTRIQSALG